MTEEDEMYSRYFAATWKNKTVADLPEYVRRPLRSVFLNAGPKQTSVYACLETIRRDAKDRIERGHGIEVDATNMDEARFLLLTWWFLRDYCKDCTEADVREAYEDPKCELKLKQEGRDE